MSVSPEDHITRIIDLKNQYDCFLESCPDNFTQKAEVEIYFNDAIDEQFKLLDKYIIESKEPE